MDGAPGLVRVGPGRRGVAARRRGRGRRTRDARGKGRRRGRAGRDVPRAGVRRRRADVARRPAAGECARRAPGAHCARGHGVRAARGGGGRRRSSGEPGRRTTSSPFPPATMLRPGACAARPSTAGCGRVCPSRSERGSGSCSTSSGTSTGCSRSTRGRWQMTLAPGQSSRPAQVEQRTCAVALRADESTHGCTEDDSCPVGLPPEDRTTCGCRSPDPRGTAAHGAGCPCWCRPPTCTTRTSSRSAGPSPPGQPTLPVGLLGVEEEPARQSRRPPQRPVVQQQDRADQPGVGAAVGQPHRLEPRACGRGPGPARPLRGAVRVHQCGATAAVRGRSCRSR